MQCPQSIILYSASCSRSAICLVLCDFLLSRLDSFSLPCVDLFEVQNCVQLWEYVIDFYTTTVNLSDMQDTCNSVVCVVVLLNLNVAHYFAQYFSYKLISVAIFYHQLWCLFCTVQYGAVLSASRSA